MSLILLKDIKVKPPPRPQTITPAQCRGARHLVGVKQARLAKMIGVSKTVITNFERERFGLRFHNMQALVEAFDELGIEFIEDIGFQKKQAGYTLLMDADNLIKLWTDILDTLHETGGELLIQNAAYKPLGQCGEETVSAHIYNNISILGLDGITQIGRGRPVPDDLPWICRWIGGGDDMAVPSYYIYGTHTVAMRLWRDCGILHLTRSPLHTPLSEKFWEQWAHLKGD